TGASRKHNLITGNISAELILQMKGRKCESYASDMRVKVTATGLYTYPDVVMVCGDPKFEDSYVDTLLNPTVLVEVLSSSTERYDRIAKSSYYRTLDSLTEYLLVAQDRYRVEHYVRQADNQWVLFDYGSLDNVIELESIGCSLKLRDIYDKVSLDPPNRIERH
ncbi:MAG: Uma2 family endonuclease, partial [Acidobacteriota bacterium]|nr:Uma2 family endonuclease [Acidobacteriota bacterium]